MLAFTVACGGGSFNDPPGFGNAVIAQTQNPLVAQYTIPTAFGCAGQVMVEFGPDTSYGRTTSWYPTAASRQPVTILVAGMKASTTYHMRAQGQAQCASGTSTFTSGDVTFTTGALPSIAFPTLTVSRPSPSTSSPENPGIEMVTVTTPSTPALFTDRDANPIWYYDVGVGNGPDAFKILTTGHFDIVVILGESGSSTLREIDLAGNTVHDMPIATLGQKMQAAGFDFVPTNYHHDLLPLDNGHVIVLTNFTKSFTNLPGYPGTTEVIGDGVIDLDQNWNPVWAWNSFDYLDVNRHLNGLPDWTHSNAIVYSPIDGNLILSMRHQSWVLKLDYNNGAGAGDILWKLGYQGDFQLTVAGAPSDDPSEWFSFQHFPSIVSQEGSQTNLTIWDNGDNRVLDSGTICGVLPDFITPCFSRATLFNVDEQAKVANLLWDNAPGGFGVWGGSINQLANGNVEFDLNAPSPPLGSTVGSQVQEVTQSSSPQVVWQMDVSVPTENAYRCYRYPSLYPGVAWQY
jgi:arylsulfate sulfotransferase